MVKDTTYYDILGAPPTATEVELKKAYRKRAIQLHPDKNGNDPGAAAKFQDLGEAYAVLSNPEQRKLYDEVGVDGLKEADGAGPATDIDPSEFFKMIFGGDSFEDWIGRLSMFEEMNQTAEILGETEEDLGENAASQTGSNTAKSGAKESGPENGGLKEGGLKQSGAKESGLKESGPKESGPAGGSKAEEVPLKSTELAAKSDLASPVSAGTSQLTAKANNEATKKKKSKKTISREQREKLYQAHEESQRAKQERIATLSKKLISRIEAIQSCTTEDSKNKYRQKLQKEFDDLKIESFGIQLLHLIGKIYVTQANATILSSKTFGVSKIFTSVKSKSERVKGGFQILKSAMDAQASAEEMMKLQAAREQSGAELTEHEKYEQMEAERVITGKLLATAWASTQFEVNGILNKVTHKVLNDKLLSKKQRVARAEALILIGKEMLATKRTPEEEEEARIFEEMMAEASAKKSKGKKKKMSEQDFEAYVASMDADSSKD